MPVGPTRILVAWPNASDVTNDTASERRQGVNLRKVLFIRVPGGRFLSNDLGLISM